MSTLTDNSVLIASIGSTEAKDGLYWHRVNIYRHKSGKFFRTESGGAGSYDVREPMWLTRAEAAYELRHETDPITGYHYSDEQIEKMLDMPFDCDWNWKNKNVGEGRTDRELAE